LERNQIIAVQTITNYVQAARDIQQQLGFLKGVLPTNQEQYHPNRLIYRQSRQVTDAARTLLMKMAKRGMAIPPDLLGIVKGVSKATKIFKGISPLSMGFSVVKGVFGTFMGLYNTYQMEKMRSELNGVIQKQNKVIEVLEDHQEQLASLQREMAELQAQAHIFEITKLPSLQASLNRGLATIKAAFNQCVHAVQQAHHHRLAVDYFDPTTLGDIYETIIYQSREAKYRLLTRYPSDLFQLEVSYMFDGLDVILFLHVPMVPEDSLLTLYRLKPFPIPFSETMALLPRPSTALLALSNRIPRSITRIEHADLIDCHQVNQVYLCERHGVMENNIKSSCLGALFEQDIPSAQQVCDLELVPYQEAVLQLRNNWFLIYSPIMFTSYMTCLNETTDAKPIQIGVQQLFVDPSCRVDLKNHSLTSEISMKLDAEITYFPWKMADLNAFSITEDDIKAALESRTSAGEKSIFLAEVLQHKHFSSRIPPYSLVTGGLITTAVMAMILLAASLLGTHRIMAFRNRMRRIRQAVEHIQPRVAEHLPRRPSLAPFLPNLAPPLYPGLPNDNDHEEQYELMNLNPDALARNIQRLSRAASKISQLSRLSHGRSSSAPTPTRRSRHSSGDTLRRLFAEKDPETDDDYDIDDNVHNRSTGTSFSPMPMPRRKTPSYMFLKATAVAPEN
jgi:hypothetical protein